MTATRKHGNRYECVTCGGVRRFRTVKKCVWRVLVACRACGQVHAANRREVEA